MARQKRTRAALACMAALSAAVFFLGERYTPRENIRGGETPYGGEDGRKGAVGEETRAGSADGAGTGDGAAAGTGAGTKPGRDGGAGTGDGSRADGNAAGKGLLGEISPAEEQLLCGLYEALENGDMEKAARILNENPEQLRVLTDQSLRGEVRLLSRDEERGYRMETLGKGTAGFGLALTKFNTVFFGEFQNGKPEGRALAVQAVVLDGPRYTFADGQWSGGRMNGEGKAGYRYYGGGPESGYASSVKSGFFRDNLMDGDLAYRVESGDGRSLGWKIRSAAGVTVLDDRWDYYGGGGEYMLRSEEDPDRAYVIPEGEKDAVRWNNLILWGEEP